MDHQGIIKLYEVYESTKYIHLLFPYLEGGELFERLKSKGQYKEVDCLPIMHRILSSLEYLTKVNIVHRDLKPENLILKRKNDDTDIIIADFGLAAIHEDPTKKLKLRCGSLGYVAPEVLGKEGYGCESDTFSVGVLFYALLTGRPVFRGKSQQLMKEN